MQSSNKGRFLEVLDQTNALVYWQGDFPPFSKITADKVGPWTKAVVDAARLAFKLIEEGKTSMGLLEALQTLDQEFSRAWSPVPHLLAVQNSDGLRKAYEDVLPSIVQFGLEAGQSEKIYSELVKLQSSGSKKLSGAQLRLLEQKILDAKHTGVGLTGKAKDRFNEIAQRLSAITTKFSNNVLDATKAYSLTVTKPEDISGIPPHVLALASQAYNKTESGSTPEKGPWRFTLEAPSYIPFMENCPNRHLREEMYRAMLTLASKDAFDNTPVIQEILKLRSEQAQLLGYKNFVEMSLASKMAPSKQKIYELLEEMRTAAWDKAHEEHKKLQMFAEKNGFQDKLLEWDVPYWSQRMKEALFSFSDEQLAEYFPFEHVLTELFGQLGKIFGIKVQEVSGEAPVWQKDVRFFKVFDETSAEWIASFYLDPFSRPAEKRGGAWMNHAVDRWSRGQTIDRPLAYLVCNMTPPVGTKPSLLSFDQVRTLFHEFGHGLQHMLTEIDEPGVSGINGVEWDAVELPSQFMENWLFHIPVLRSLSSHFETKKQLPDDLIAKILEARTYRAAAGMLRQLQFATSDLELHSGDVKDPHALFGDIAKRTSVFPPRPESRFLCGFSHIFAGGYAAGYYSYKWAEVLSADAFGAFEEVGLDNVEGVKKLGTKFRKTVLGLGGSLHPMEVFKLFRGREPSTKALLKHSGLA